MYNFERLIKLSIGIKRKILIFVVFISDVLLKFLKKLSVKSIIV